MKRLLLLALILAACQGHWIVRPPDAHMGPKLHPPTATQPSLMPTVTPTPFWSG